VGRPRRIANLVAGCAAIAALTGRARSAAADDIAFRSSGWTLSPVIDVRLRVEYRHGPDRLEDGRILERSRLGLAVERDWFTGQLVLQDARALGIAPSPIGGPAPLAEPGVYEVWLQAADGPARYVRFGRQAISWGEGRLLGTDEWSPAGRSLDAVRAATWFDGGEVEVLGAVLSNPSASPAISIYGQLVGARAAVTPSRSFAIEAYALGRVAQENPVPDLEGTVKGWTATGALRAYGVGARWDWGIEGAYQIGHVDNLDESRAAWAAAARVAYSFHDVPTGPALRLGAAYASGDAKHARYGTFDPLLPDTARWHGVMNLLAWSNEEELSLRVSAEPESALVYVEYRYARLANPASVWRAGDLSTVGAAPQNRDAELGHEVDATFIWPRAGAVGFRVGYSLFVLGRGGRAVEEANQLGAQDVSHYVYLQGTFRLPY
jgi:hypothetical protein